MEVVLRLQNYFQVDALTVVDFTMLYVVARRLLLSSRVSSLVINLLTINLSFRNGPLEKLWGGGKAIGGILEPQEIFFVIKFLV